MLYVFTATYYEASAWILHYGLKKETGIARFEVFGNEEAGVRLTVTGTGMVSAAVAVGSICTAFLPGRGDFLLNAGICAGMKGGEGLLGELFLCNKITEEVTGKTFYPDLLYCHRFREAEIRTGPGVFREGAWDGPDFFLYDMEASSVYQAGSRFFAPHRMVFLKIVSDGGDAGAVTPESAKELMSLNMGAMADYAGGLLAVGRQEAEGGERREDAELKRLCRDMCCSVSMAESVKQYIRYCRLAGVDYGALFGRMYEEGRLPCKSKKEGKRRFGEFKQWLL